MEEYAGWLDSRPEMIEEALPGNREGLFCAWVSAVLTAERRNNGNADDTDGADCRGFFRAWRPGMICRRLFKDNLLCLGFPKNTRRIAHFFRLPVWQPHIIYTQITCFMKIQLSLLLSGSLWVAACTSTPEAPAAAAPAAAAESTSPQAKFPVHCFENRMPDGSVLSFQYTEYYDEIVGILDYSFYEKDGAHGTFKGTKAGNLITATWSYTIEGSEQAEEILFKIEGDKALKASGELTEGESGGLVLKDPATVKWEETFTRVRCD